MAPVNNRAGGSIRRRRGPETHGEDLNVMCQIFWSWSGREKKFTRKAIRSRRTVWKLHRGAEIKDIFMYRYIYFYIYVYGLRLEGIWANLAPSLWELWGCSTQKVAQSWLAAQMILLWEFCENPNVTSSICPMKRSVLPNLQSPSRAGRRPTTSVLQDPVASHGSRSSPSSWPPEAKTPQLCRGTPEPD